jgi:oligoribonuclease NrnB/cAMP/cGMP phosphodiesterase (DHH superfamily)
MQGFYNLTTKIKDTLALDAFVNTVTYGDIFQVDLNKQDIFPLSHFIVNSATLNGSTWQFSMSLLCMDIVDESKSDTVDKFLGNDNEQDVLNTQMAVINRLLELLRRGDLHEELYQLTGSPLIEPFVDRFDNKLAGWTLTFDVLIPNTMTIC